MDSLSPENRASVAAAMKDVAVQGLVAARHLDGDIYEVRADGDRVIYRILFAAEGSRSQVLLSLHGFAKTSRKTPPETIRLAKERLRSWRARATP